MGGQVLVAWEIGMGGREREMGGMMHVGPRADAPPNSPMPGLPSAVAKRAVCALQNTQQKCFSLNLIQKIQMQIQIGS